MQHEMYTLEQCTQHDNMTTYDKILAAQSSNKDRKGT
jgi:hypothetical protein